jgi:Putative adhesin
MTSRFLPIMALVAAIAAAAPALAAEKHLDRTFQVAPGGRLNVDLDGGMIVVKGSDAHQVVVRMRAKGSERELERITMSAEKDATGVAVVGKRDGERGWLAWLFSNADVDVTVEVPRAYNLELHTSGGNLDVRGVDGANVGRTSGGRINVEAVNGDVKMRTSGGSVNLKQIAGTVDVHTSGGRIDADQIQGGLRVDTSGGSIHCHHISGPIEASTSGGSISIELIGENQGIVAKTSGGSITLRVPSTTNGLLNASTSGGSVSTDLPIKVSEVGQSSLQGTLNAGGAEILARSSGGSIHIVNGG